VRRWFLAGRLARRIPGAVALDIDAPVLDRAPARFATAPIRWMHGDVIAATLPAAGVLPG
jgi:hypothetical protein